jgi:hypothetical protein
VAIVAKENIENQSVNLIAWTALPGGIKIQLREEIASVAMR